MFEAYLKFVKGIIKALFNRRVFQKKNEKE